MTYARSYGLDELRYVNNPMVDLALQQNTAPDRTINSQLDLPDAMMRYQEEILNDRTPEKRPREDEQGGEEEVRERSRKIMNIHQYGDVRGDMDLAYKPEIEQVPQPFQNHKENRYNMFQRHKQLHARYAWRGEAQKDSLMRTINTDPRYRHADTRKYIPGYIRTMPKTTIEDHVVPLYEKGRFCKPIQNYRNVENNWMLQYCKDNTRTEGVKKKIERHRQNIRQPHVDAQPVETKVNMMYKFMGGTYEKTGALRPLAQGKGQDDKIAKFERPRPKIKNKGYINPGAIMEIDDLLKINERVNKIEKAVKKATQRRPTLEYATADKPTDGTQIAKFEKARPKVNRPTTFIIHPGLENIDDLPEPTKNIAQKEKRKPWKQNRNTGVEAIDTGDQAVDFATELPKIKRENIRAFMGETVESQPESLASTEEKHHKQQKNLTGYTEGHDLSDATHESELSKRKAFQGTPEYRMGGVDESISYDDKIAYINSEKFATKARNQQRRSFNPDALIVETDYEANINTRKPLVQVTADDKKNFRVTEYMLQRQLSDEV